MSSSRKRSQRSVRTRARLEKGALLSIALGELACSHPTAPGPTTSVDASPTAEITAAPPKSTAAAPPTIEDTAEVVEKLAPYAITPRSVARRTLYTWTTRSQTAELEKNPVLLTRTESPQYGAAYFDQVLHARSVMGKDPLAKLLRTSGFARARFAWPAPWATLLGLGGETYGEDLIQVTLKPEAWIVAMYTSKAELEVFDLEGRKVSTEDALAHPERIAAAYFAHDKPVTGYAASMAGPEERMAYREYVLCNESMIEAWSTRTEAITKELAAEADALLALAEHVREHPPIRERYLSRWNVLVATETWRLYDPARTPLTMYETALAFPAENYVPEARRLVALANKLKALRVEGAPLTHTPKAVFPPKSALVPSPAPRVVRPGYRGTY
jgi:hypothetical protein